MGYCTSCAFTGYVLLVVSAGDSLTDFVRDTHHKGVTHAEGTVTVAHAGVSPTAGESLQLIQLIGHKTAVRARIANHNMLKAGGSRASFAGQDGTRGRSSGSGKDIEPSV